MVCAPRELYVEEFLIVFLPGFSFSESLKTLHPASFLTSKSTPSTKGERRDSDREREREREREEREGYEKYRDGHNI